MAIEECPHPARRKTLVGNRALCSRCFRPYKPAPVCWGCGAVPDEYRTLGQLRLRDVNGKPHCERCRAELRAR